MRMVEIAAAEFEGEPVFFKLAGETFECLPFVPVGIQQDLAKYDYSLVKTLAFLEAILKDESERKRFQKFIHGEAEVHQRMLTATLEKLIQEAYAARPLVTSEVSSGGPKTTSPSSKPRSKSKAKRSSG